MIIKSNIVGSTKPRANWDQSDPKKPDYIKGKEAVDEAIENLNGHSRSKGNPHGVTAEQVGARPDTWMPTAEQVGARPDTWMPTASEVGAVTETQVVNMINNALGVIENGTY